MLQRKYLPSLLFLILSLNASLSQADSAFRFVQQALGMRPKDLIYSSSMTIVDPLMRGTIHYHQSQMAELKFEINRRGADRIIIQTPDAAGNFSKVRRQTQVVYEGRITRLPVREGSMLPAELAARVSVFVQEHDSDVPSSQDDSLVVGIEEGTLVFVRSGSEKVFVSFLPKFFPKMVGVDHRIMTNEKGDIFSLLVVQEGGQRLYPSTVISDCYCDKNSQSALPENVVALNKEERKPQIVSDHVVHHSWLVKENSAGLVVSLSTTSMYLGAQDLIFSMSEFSVHKNDGFEQIVLKYYQPNENYGTLLDPYAGLRVSPQISIPTAGFRQTAKPASLKFSMSGQPVQVLNFSKTRIKYCQQILKARY